MFINMLIFEQQRLYVLNWLCECKCERFLYFSGGRIILACRDVIKANKAADDLRRENGGVYIVKKLDLASFSSIHKFAEDVLENEKQIHALINNAGKCGLCGKS